MSKKEFYLAFFVSSIMVSFLGNRMLQVIGSNLFKIVFDFLT